MTVNAKITNIVGKSIRAVKTGCLHRMEPSRIRPRLVALEVTDWCNSRCKQCSIWQNRPTPSEERLTPSEIGKMLSMPLFNDVERVLLTGGEVSLRDDITEIIDAIHNARPSASLWYSTNGLLADRVIAHVNHALEQGIKIGVGISLDGIGATHDGIRGIPGNFAIINDRLLPGLLELREQYPCLFHVGTGFVLSDLTVDQYPAVKAYTQSKGVPMMAQALDSSDFYNNSGLPIAPCCRDKIRAVVESLDDYVLKDHWLRRLDGQAKTFRCFALSTFLFIHINGDISPCLRHYDWIFGNVRDEGFWDSPQIAWGRHCVAKCDPQCLNDWGLIYSLSASFFPIAALKIKEKARKFRKPGWTSL